MYANTASRKSADNKNIAALMEYDSAQSVRDHPDVKIADLAQLAPKHGKLALVRQFIYSQHEAVAYIEEQTVIVMIVLSARTAEDYESALPAFRKLVDSYFFMTSEIHIE